jgi:hypothetical protein
MRCIDKNTFMTNTLLEEATDLAANDYLVVGLATCFVKEDGEVHEVEVIEPIPSAALEAIVKGIPTSYKLALATTIGDIVSQLPQKPAGFPDSAQFSDEFVFRAIAAARTYKRRDVAQTHIPLGTTRDDFKYSIERKRVLNMSRIVTTDDNVKQHSHTHKVL